MSTIDVKKSLEKRKKDLSSGREGTMPQNVPEPMDRDHSVHLTIGDADLVPDTKVEIGNVKVRQLARDYIRNPKSKPDASMAGTDADFAYNSDEEMDRRSDVAHAGEALSDVEKKPKFARMNKMFGDK